MASIPISEYISIGSRIIGSTVENRDFSGLVITKDAMKTNVPSSYSQTKTDYGEGKAVALTKDDVAACFDSTTDIYKFAAKYFGYSGGNRRPSILNVALVLATDTNPVDTYNRVAAETINWGACTVLGTIAASAGEGVDFTNSQIAAVAEANEALDTGNIFIVCTTSANVTTTGSGSTAVAKIGGVDSFDNLVFTHCFIGTDKYGASCAMAWYASVNYNDVNASASIDFKQFSNETAAVSTLSNKRAYDNGRLNYIGKVQVYGTGMSFYQQGANMDGTDLGVIRDSNWLKGVITVGYFNLQANAQKVPANYVGNAMVRNIIVAAATQAIENGVILLDKPLDSDMILQINQYAGNTTAADEVAASGYYISTKIVKEGGRYLCEYTLIYAKGDHIGKVVGTHILF